MVKRIKRRQEKASKKKNNKLFFWISAIVLGVVAVVAFISSISMKETEKKSRSFHLTEKETRSVLDPAMFTGRAYEAYAAAKKYSDICNEVFCYCSCDEPPVHHKTLLSCFTDKHGAS